MNIEKGMHRMIGNGREVIKRKQLSPQTIHGEDINYIISPRTLYGQYYGRLLDGNHRAKSRGNGKSERRENRREEKCS